MTKKIIELNLPINYSKDTILRKISNNGYKNKSFSILNKSLDARDKKNIHWKLRIEIVSKSLKKKKIKNIIITEFKKRNKKIIIVGSGPAGLFSALLLQQSGFSVTIIEQGQCVDNRERDIKHFEQTGVLNERSNYSFGEGGAGTFSDGKLTARNKKNKIEKEFVFNTLIEAGAPEEIAFLSHPHLGSDNLKKIVKNLRIKFIELGGIIKFGTKFKKLVHKKGTVKYIITDKGDLYCDYLILSIGHSSLDTYQSLIKSDIPFRVKPFAIGSRVEHIQEQINLSQWGVSKLSGVKAAEYRLTHKSNDFLPVYSFCMCPGGKIVPSTPRKDVNIVNGMSNYARNNKFANSAIIAAVNLESIFNKDIGPRFALNWLYELENKFFNLNKDYSAPALLISDFIKGKTSQQLPESSYPFNLINYDFKELFPEVIYNALLFGIREFTKKIKGFENGIIMGLESKSSSIIQVKRDGFGKVLGFDNLNMVGEGSGFSGGIVSSAIDGIKSSLNLIENN